MIKDGVYRLKENASPIKDVDFPKGKELEVVGNVIYIDGHPLPFNMQESFNSWMKVGMKDGLFLNDTRR